MRSKILSVVAAVALGLTITVGAATASSATANTPCVTAKTFNYGTPSVVTLPTTSAGSTDCYLVQGNSGNGVKALQRGLVYCENISVGAYGVDGSFGASTKSAVKLLQSYNGLVQDGQYGNKTRNAMYFLGGASNPAPGSWYTCN
ncbi:MAG: peptidoglycan-binding protein [Cellulomonadaceae bacterium]|nr:peptidoglycan-binding protein [Cellulomonadaceae bacterium]